MKKLTTKIALFIFVSVVILTFAGCGNPLTTSTYNDEKENIRISLSYPEKSNCNFYKRE